MAIPISPPYMLPKPKPIFCAQTKLKLYSHWNSISTVKYSTLSGAKQSASLLLSRFQFYTRKNLALPRSMAATASCTTDENLKLATFVTEANKTQVGVVRHGSIWPLERVVNLPTNIDVSHINDMIYVINHWDSLYSCMKLEGPGIQLEDVKLLAPIPRPSGAIMCIGKNYADHVKEIDTWKTAPGIASPNIPKVLDQGLTHHAILFPEIPFS